MESGLRIVLGVIFAVIVAMSAIGVVHNFLADRGYYANQIPSRYQALKGIPVIVDQHSLSSEVFASNYSRGFSEATALSEHEFISNFEYIEANRLNISYVIANYTFPEATLGVAVVTLSSGDYHAALSSTIQSIRNHLENSADSTCTQGLFTKNMSTSSVVYYEAGKVFGQCGFIYTMIEYEPYSIIVLQYSTLEPPTLPQLAAIADSLAG